MSATIRQLLLYASESQGNQNTKKSIAPPWLWGRNTWTWYDTCFSERLRIRHSWEQHNRHRVVYGIFDRHASIFPSIMLPLHFYLAVFIDSVSIFHHRSYCFQHVGVHGHPETNTFQFPRIQKPFIVVLCIVVPLHCSPLPLFHVWTSLVKQMTVWEWACRLCSGDVISASQCCPGTPCFPRHPRQPLAGPSTPRHS